MAAAMKRVGDECAAASLRRSGKRIPNSGNGGAARPISLARFGTWGTIVLVFGFASLVVLAILLGALVVTVAVAVFVIVAALVYRLPFVRRRPR
jgi:Na+/H+-dicarboxylate symporter